MTLFDNIKVFFEALEGNEKNFLSLDVGQKSIGLALGRYRLGLATPYGIMKRCKLQDDLRTLQEWAQKERADSFVVGWPKRMDGTKGRACQRCERFALELATSSCFPVLLWDERLSTKAIQRTNMKEGRPADDLAAAYIAQGVLDWRRMSARDT